MNLSKKWMLAIGAVLLSGVLATGAAFAAGREVPGKGAGEVSPAVQELLTEVRNLRQTRMDQLKAEIEALIDKAVAEGKVSQEQADRLKKGGGRHHGPGFRLKGKHPLQRGMKPFFQGAAEEQVKAKLDAAVKSGRITQEQADAMLKRWQEAKAQQAQ